MRLRLLKSKIHRARVTETQLHYAGSIAIDEALMEAAGIHPYEQVLVANLANGTRHETYAVPAEAHSGIIRVMGAAAHLAGVDDLVIIMSFADFAEEELAGHKPTVVLVDEHNKPRPQ